MMAVRERAVQVMAALDRRVLCLDDFVGQSWSAWAERAGLTAADGSDGEDCSKNGKKTTETMTLRKEDMSIFGHYPGHDDFYLVVCSQCSQVVKPQAFEKHFERRHGPVGKLYAHLRSTPPAAQQRAHSRHGHTPPAPGHGTASWSGRSQGSGGPPRPAPQSPSTPPQFRHSKTSKDAVRLSPLDKSSSSAHSESSVFKQPPPLEPPRNSPPPSLRDPPWPHGGPSPSRPAATEKSPSQRAETGSSPATPGHARGSRPHKVSKKECDLDKHCGVLDPERKKVCTRLLTCNIHSVHQRRKVMGRSKNFNQLLAEMKMGSKSRDRVAPSLEGPAAPLPAQETPREPTNSPHCRRPLANSPAFRLEKTRTLSESAPEEEKAVREEGSARAPSPLTQGRISSDESEGEAAEEPADWHSSPWHPKPLAYCTFGSCALGHGIFTFDRRLHHLRSAVSAMVESHLSAHLWKKIPQASDPQSHSPSAKPSAVPASPSSTSHHSKSKAGNHSSPSVKTSSYSSQGPGKEAHSQSSSTSKAYSQSEKFGGGSGGSQSAAAHSKPTRTASQPGGPGRPKNPVGRPSKQQLRLRDTEPAASASAAAPRKRKTSLSEADTVSPDRNCLSPDRERDRDRVRTPVSSKTSPAPNPASVPDRPMPPSHGQTNGSLSPGSKPPRPQLGPSSAESPHGASSWPFKRTHTSSPDLHGRGGNSGHHSRVPGFEHRGLGKKRKSSDSSPPSKAHRLPTPPHAGFYTWKESKGSALPVGGEKKLSAPKPKLHR
ncbi:ataxin-7-like protein 2 [Astyanax mexicanus]|uniref:Ataxin-7-like protein 2 n=1 Tax=Astyanax mexicanus TaxID=7994 RepID=A0A8T2KN48_ASTMX|nr:ataxin-7-like protein 2 [Astyanax mexicanus]